MCGILAILGTSESENEIRKKALQLSSKLRHRGPDWLTHLRYFIEYLLIKI